RDWNAFGYADGEFDAGIDGFHDRVSGERRGDEDDRGGGARGLDGLFDGIGGGESEGLSGAFAGGDAADHGGAVVEGLLSVEGALVAGEALDHQAGVFVDENAHFARATTFSAPSFMPSAMVKFSPDSRRICCPSSTLVPSMRTTMGTLT